LSSGSVSYALALAGLAGFCVIQPVAAQDDADMTGSPAGKDRGEKADESDGAREPTRPMNIMITVPTGEVNEAQMRECEDEEEASTISGEIIVCRRTGSNAENRFSSGKDAQRRYAEETAFKGAPGTPDVAGEGIFRGPATVSGACFVPPCPGEAPLIIDIESLPEAPAGSDADRIARGLPPLEEEDASPEEIRKRREALGLPPPKFDSGP
jgi:hypothetical protein